MRLDKPQGPGCRKRLPGTCEKTAADAITTPAKPLRIRKRNGQGPPTP
jgi:hypothetical protein